MSVTTPTPFRTVIAATALTGIGILTLASCGERREEAQFQPFQYATTSGEVKIAPRRTLRETPLERSWDLKLPHPVYRSWVSPALPHYVFFQVRETYEVIAVDMMSGAPKWVTQPFPKPPKVPAGGSHALVSGQGDKAVYDDRAWVVSDDTLYSFDAVYGQVAWRYDLPFPPSTGPLGIGPHSNQRVFFGDWEGRIHVITYDDKRHFPFELWQMNLRAAVVAPMIETDGLVYAADQEGGVHCFKLDRAEVWQQQTKAAIFGGMVTRGRVLFVGNEDNKLFAFNRLNGDLLGTLFVNGPVRKAPFIFNDEPGKLYVFIDHADPAIGGLACINTQNDVLKVEQVGTGSTTTKRREIMRLDMAWRIPNVSRLVGSTPMHLFVTGSDPAKRNQIVAINRALGRVDWTWDCAEEHVAGDLTGLRKLAYITEYQDPTNLNRSVFTADNNGHVIAYRMFGDKANDHAAPAGQVAAVQAAPAAPAPAPAPAAAK